MIFKTFRGRFVFVSTAVLSFLIISAATFIYFTYSKTLLDAIDRSLHAAAKRGTAGGATSEQNIIMEFIKIANNEFYQIITHQGKVTIAFLDSNHPWPVNRKLIRIAMQGVPQFETMNYKYENYRILYYPVDADTVLRARRSQEGLDRSVTELKRLFLFSFPPFMLIFLILGWMYAGKMLDPVRKIKSLAEEIRQGKWDQQLTLESYGKEINELGLILNQMVDTMRRSVESQKRFTADVSHEIRSPLTSLRGTIEVALRKKRHPEEYEEVLRNNLSDVIRLTRLTDNLLFLSRADHKILALRRQWFDVEHMLDRVVETYRDKALQEGILVHVDVQHGIELNGDIELLEQAFSNLVDNAIKYTNRGGHIAVKSVQEGDNIKITVSDSGIGIPAEQIPHIFERFYRVDREQSRKFSGTGLGLAITHWIIKAHNGEISVTSAPDKGSEFTLTLPKKTEISI
jgi:heavy metal sensor kinase